MDYCTSTSEKITYSIYTKFVLKKNFFLIFYSTVLCNIFRPLARVHCRSGVDVDFVLAHRQLSYDIKCGVWRKIFAAQSLIFVNSITAPFD